MHFKTLVTVCMPTVEEDPHENAAVEQSIELLQARKDDLAKDIMAELTLCSLMGRTTNFARQLVGAVEEVMTPYSTEPPEEYNAFHTGSLASAASPALLFVIAPLFFSVIRLAALYHKAIRLSTPFRRKNVFLFILFVLQCAQGTCFVYK